MRTEKSMLNQRHQLAQETKPFMNMLRHAAHVHSSQSLALLRSGRRLEDTVLIDVLQVHENSGVFS